MHYACQFGHPDVVQALLYAGVDLSQKDQDGETPLTIAKRKNHQEIVQLLKNAGANIR
ncbi:MAG: ankyrin repeat domain-containing protein [Nitrospirae bacterium]|nr:ankyrin repeat domain-containing protein [Nitrospirota bacterium]